MTVKKREREKKKNATEKNMNEVGASNKDNALFSLRVFFFSSRTLTDSEQKLSSHLIALIFFLIIGLIYFSCFFVLLFVYRWKWVILPL